MALKIYNTLSRKKETFKPIHEGKVNMYVCGPTVQDFMHIGHGKNYTAFDVIVRYLRYSGYDVLYVQNITDVGHLLDTGEDRVLKKARQASAKPMQIVETYMKLYFDNMDALGNKRPDISPRAASHVPEQIEMVQELIEKGHAYESNGSVYFSVTSYPDYGKLSGRKLDDQEAGARLAVNEEKRHPADFAIWKNAGTEHLMRWNSPWGEGFPGWHIECSAMARKYLGKTFDIHGGGIDNIFPHNECELAQSEAAHGETFANTWMLTGSLTLDGVKMSKSLGNVVRISDAVADYRPEVLRMFFLSAHYSNPIDFTEKAVTAAEKGWQRMYGAVSNLRQALSSAPEGDADAEVVAMLDEAKTAFIAKMDDDFNAPAAIAILQDTTRKVNTLLNADSPMTQGSLNAIDDFYKELGGGILGIIPDGIDEGANAEREAGLIELMIQLRNQARENKDWATSDKIRDELNELGVTLLDGKDGTTWQVD